MEKITSFTIDHIRLIPGVYVSRIDYVGEYPVTTFDLRMTSPNDEPVMNTAEIHAIEPLGATFLRNHPTYGDKILYFGPMGCRTGFYLMLNGRYSSADIVPLIREMYTFIAEFEGEIPEVSERSAHGYPGGTTPVSGINFKRGQGFFNLGRGIFKNTTSPIIYKPTSMPIKTRTAAVSPGPSPASFSPADPGTLPAPGNIFLSPSL